MLVGLEWILGSIPSDVAKFVIVSSPRICTKRKHLRLWMTNNLNNINGC